MWIAARDRRTPLAARLVALATAAYAFSPVDLIPDFIPVLGILDDLLIVPVGIWVALRLIPRDLMQEFRTDAAARMERPRSWTAAAIIMAIWLAAAIALGWYLLR